MKTIKHILIAKVHIAKKDLSLDNNSYREILKRITGKDSSAKCSDKQLDKVLEEFNRLGWKNSGNLNRKTRKAPNGLVRKVYALWGELQKMGQVKSKDKIALDRFVEKHTGVSSVQFIDNKQAMSLIEILKKWIGRCEDV